MCFLKVINLTASALLKIVSDYPDILLQFPGHVGEDHFHYHFLSLIQIVLFIDPLIKAVPFEQILYILWLTDSNKGFSGV